MPGMTGLFALLAAPGFVFQPAGQFHDDEPVVRDGERMLALYMDDDGARLEQADVAMHRVPDPIVDAPDGPDSGWQVGPEDDHLLGYLRGATLRAGELVLASPAIAEPLRLEPIHLEFAGQLHVIATACDPEPAVDNEDASIAQCRITLSDAAGRTSTLASLRGYAAADGTMLIGDDASPRLLFAGDLDRDGKLDLIFDITDHYNVRHPAVFLSSEADAEAPVRVVATYRSVGC